MSVSADWSWQRVALAGMRDALMLPAWIVGFGLIGIGSLARDVGYPVDVAVLSTILVWAGPSQVLFFASIAAGAAWSAIVIAIAFASLRFLPMTMAILPLLRRPGQSIWQQLILAHYVAVTAWSEGLRRLPGIAPHQRVAYFLGFANTCMAVSSIGTFAGYYLLGALPVPFAAGLLCLTPMFFLISLIAGLRHRGDSAALLLGLAFAPISARFIGGGFDLIVAGLIAGTLAFLIGRKCKPA
ncbi:AzlC family ABC transporter permease [Bosea beijingensis]|uniref:AzlC family ABC transporter permease n=1 Tax=Bosea beijingensis TaxID=3068632 RepID=UPI002741A49C|nr:AzlC family ABC transporter permease [Bosea sp. REN20]